MVFNFEWFAWEHILFCITSMKNRRSRLSFLLDWKRTGYIHLELKSTSNVDKFDVDWFRKLDIGVLGWLKNESSVFEFGTGGHGLKFRFWLTSLDELIRYGSTGLTLESMDWFLILNVDMLIRFWGHKMCYWFYSRMDLILVSNIDCLRFDFEGLGSGWENW